MNKIFVVVDIVCPPDLNDLLIAELDLLDYESFIELDNGFRAAIARFSYDEKELGRLVSKYKKEGRVTFISREAEQENWNELWEKHYDPVIIDNRCLVRASFHKETGNFPLEIIINPKMSFGTGHHHTTYLMVSILMTTPINGLKVLDAGCGTGILSIASVKLGASEVWAVDIEEWAIRNSKENAEINSALPAEFILGTILDIPSEKQFNLILANINRNILVTEMRQYESRMAPGGRLIISGFFIADCEVLKASASSRNLVYMNQYERNGWAALVFEKKSV